MIAGLKTHSAPSLEPSLLVTTRPVLHPNIFNKIFSLETSLMWNLIARSKLIPLVPDWPRLLWRLKVYTPEGDTPYNGKYGEAPPEKGTFFRVQVYKRVAILLVEVYQRVK